MSKEKTMTRELKAIRSWLAKDFNTEAKLAAELGYKSSTVVSMWIKRGRVPDHQKQSIMEVVTQ
jgi:hypothetical protein